MSLEDIFDEIRIENGNIVLTERQKEWAMSIARAKLLSEPNILERLRQLQSESISETIALVRAQHLDDVSSKPA